MTSRPSAARKQRPVSAIFIGSLGSSSSSTPPDLPRLPEPPSPEGSPIAETGLPSPPGTNSTGSGSNGDDSTNAGGVRKRPSQRTQPASDMQNGRSYGARSDTRQTHNSNPFDDDDMNDNENDEDSTARFNHHRRQSTGPAPGDNLSALQRVKSLTQRNRMVNSKFVSRLARSVY